MRHIDGPHELAPAARTLLEYHGDEGHHGTAEVDMPGIEELALDVELEPFNFVNTTSLAAAGHARRPGRR